MARSTTNKTTETTASPAAPQNPEQAEANNQPGPLKELESFLIACGRSLAQGTVASAISYISQLIGERDDASDLVAKVHAAAVGEFRAPKRGVVEDVEDVLKELRYEASEMKSNYEGACKTIALMHAAAVGEVTGPKRGVVEDVHDVVSNYRAQLALAHEQIAASKVDPPSFVLGPDEPPNEEYLLDTPATPVGGSATGISTVEIAYDRFRSRQPEGEYPDWPDLDGRTQELYREAWQHVAEGGEPRTNYERAVASVLALP
jgi:hypothetical protein